MLQTLCFFHINQECRRPFMLTQSLFLVGGSLSPPAPPSLSGEGRDNINRTEQLKKLGILLLPRPV